MNQTSSQEPREDRTKSAVTIYRSIELGESGFYVYASAYHPFDGEVPDVPKHSKLIAFIGVNPQAHATKIKRLCDAARVEKSKGDPEEYGLIEGINKLFLGEKNVSKTRTNK
jgi:hypothetical protein